MTLTFPKPIRMKDPAYLSWIRRQPCLIDNVVAEAHHTTSIGARGSDYRSVPLCGKHHRELHRVGRVTFQSVRRIDLNEEVIRLLETYISARSES